MSHPPSSATINSGAINHVPFPGSEEGLSLIELVGTVEVVCALSTIRLRLTAGASTTAAATGSTPSTKIRAQLSAAVAPTADVLAGARTKIAAVPAAQPAQAVAEATGIRQFRLGGATTGTAAASVGSYVRAVLSASATAAATATSSSRGRTFRSASTVALATTAGAALRARRTPAAVTASATAIVSSTKARYRLGAPTDATSVNSSGIRIKVRRGASVSASAVSAPFNFAIKALVFPAAQVASAVAASIAARQLCATGASAAATALSSSGVALRYELGATVGVSMISTAAAADYGITQAAPTERLMIVPAYDRRMEVTL